MTDQNNVSQPLLDVKIKRHIVCRIIGFFTRILFLLCILFLLIFGSLMLRLQKHDISLKKWDNFIQNILSDSLPEDIILKIAKPVLKRDKDSFLYPRLSLDKVSIMHQGNSYNLSKVDVNFSLASLFLLKVRPSYVEVGKSDLIHKILVSGGGGELPTIDAIYKEYFGPKGVLAQLKEVKFHNISFKGDLTALDSDFSPYIDLKKADIIFSNDVAKRQVKLKTAGSINTDSSSFKFLTHHFYDANHHKIRTDLFFQDGKFSYKIFKDSKKKIIADFHADIKMFHNDIGEVFSISPKLYLYKGEIPLEGQQDTPISIKNMILTGQYFPLRQRVLFNIDEFKSSAGNIKGTVFVRQAKSKNHYFDINLMADHVNHDGFFKDEIELKKLFIHGKADEAFKNLDLKELELSLQGINIKGNAAVEKNDSDAFSARADAVIDGINKETLLSVWPVKLPGSARAWIETNLLEAKSKQGDLKFSYNQTMEFPKIDLKIPFYDAKFYYRSPMAPAENVKTDLHLEDKRLSFDIHSGEINKVSIQKGSFEIPDITSSLPKGNAKLSLKGNTVSLFEVLDQEPLEIFTPNNIHYQGKRGEFSGDISLSLPLASTITFDDVDLKGAVNVNDVAIDLVGQEYRITDYKGTVDFTNKGLTSKFSAKVNDIAVEQGSWQENFSEKSPYSTIVTGKANISDASLKNFNIDLSDYWQGSGKGDVSLKLKSGVVKELSVDADLMDAQLMVPYTNYKDPIGVTKKLKVLASQDNNDFVVKNVDIKSEKTDVKIQNILTRNGKLSEFTITSLNAKNLANNASLRYYDGETQKPKVSIKAEKLMLDEVFAYDPPMPSTSEKAEEFTRVKVDLNVDNFAIYPDKILKNLKLSADSPNETPLIMNVKGKIGSSEEIVAQVENQDAVTKRFTVTSNNAGALMKAYDSFHYYRKGQFTLNGNMKKVAQGQPSVITGNVSIDGGRLIDAPIVARIFSLASLTGIVDRLSENGLSMDKIETDFTKNGSSLKLSRGVVSGSAVGFSFAGEYNTETGDCNLNGTLVPLYEINSLVSNIPLIGDIFTSRRGEGIFGMSYRMKGKITEPKINVNPLSALTPGILRRIFE